MRTRLLAILLTLTMITSVVVPVAAGVSLATHPSADGLNMGADHGQQLKVPSSRDSSVTSRHRTIVPAKGAFIVRPTPIEHDRTTGDRYSAAVKSTAPNTTEIGPATGWPMFQLNAKKTGYMPNSTGFAITPAVKWQSTVSDVADASPVITNDTIFVAQENGNLTALDKDTGNPKWTFSTTEIEVTPVVGSNGRIYIGTAENPYSVIALNASTGTVLWNKSDIDGAVQTQPTIHNGTLYIAGFGALYALNPASGAEQWNTSIRGKGGGIFFGGGPAIANGTVFVALGQITTAGDYGSVLAMNTTTGSVVWETQTNASVLDSAPTVTESGISVGDAAGFVYSFAPDTGEIQWYTQINGQVSTSAALANSTLYYGTLNGTLVALSATTGNSVWARNINSIEITASPIIAGNVIYTGRNKLRGLNRSTGTELWNWHPPTSPWADLPFDAAPAIADETVYVAGKYGSVYAFSQPAPITANVSMRLEDPDTVETIGSGQTQQPSVILNRTITFANGSFYKFVVTNAESGVSLEVIPKATLTVSNGTSIAFLIRTDDGPLRSSPEIWVPNSPVRSDPFPASVTTDGPVAPNGTLPLSIALVNKTTNETLARTRTQTFVVGYQGMLSQNSTTGTIRLSFSQDILHRNTTIAIRLYNKSEGFTSDDALKLNLTYDTKSDAFTGAFQQSTLQGGNYSWDLRATLPSGTQFTRSSDDVRGTTKKWQPVVVGDVTTVSPSAAFSWEPEHPKANESIRFNANKTFDPDTDAITGYAWDFDGDGQPDATGKSVSYRFRTAGRHTVTLTVTDDDNQTETTSRFIVVGTGKQEVFVGSFANETNDWTYLKNATLSKGGHLVLTREKQGQVGVVWLNRNVTPPFTAEFWYRAGGGSGADGFVFMFNRNRSYNPGSGGVLGFVSGKEEVAGYGIEFDNYKNPFDPSDDHVALIESDVTNHLANTTDARVADNRWHVATIHVTNTSVTVDIDGTQVINWTGTINTTYRSIGFAGATGALTSRHLIDDVVISGDISNRSTIVSSLGDANGDSSVNAGDAVVVLRHSAGQNVAIDMAAADANGDDSVNAGDAVVILRYSAGQIDELPPS